MIVPGGAMADRDYYEVLGVAREATADQIKKAYRGLARKHHPDANPGDKTSEAKFKEIQNAYDILSDPEKKARFDQFGMAAFEGFGPAGPRSGASEWAAKQAGAGGFEDIDMSAFFGPRAGGGRGSAPVPRISGAEGSSTRSSPGCAAGTWRTSPKSFPVSRGCRSLADDPISDSRCGWRNHDRTGARARPPRVEGCQDPARSRIGRQNSLERSGRSLGTGRPDHHSDGRIPSVLRQGGPKPLRGSPDQRGRGDPGSQDRSPDPRRLQDA